ncbi:MAG TPA: glutamate synthase [Vicinamibacteria bacterium]|nr:glutamate synthase [Vicinamibacteria bacterium]
MAELTPAPLSLLLRRMLREFEREGKVFDLPCRRFWRGSEDLDLGIQVHGRRVANPAGPAAGPHGQMAQNLLLSWLAGARFVELKTVQLNDRPRISRPCIDMATVGYNVEWSQELRLEESLREYVKGSMLIDVARHLRLLGRPDDPRRDDVVLDVSVGYDLAGVRSPAVRSWIAGMKDARSSVDALRAEIPEEWRELRDLDFHTALSSQATLSTFHGCDAREIESIATFLMEGLDLDVTVKLNPTLMGREAVDGLLHDVLGYTDVETRAEDFDRDLRWPRALELSDRLSERARALGRGFRLKLSNTLVVRNRSAFLPPGEPVAYLSGPPLHVIALALVERFRRERPEVPLSFSAGVDSRNFADCVALGLAPVTVCTDLLKPGGYGRLPRYLVNLEARMRDLGTACVGDFVLRAGGHAEEAVARAGKEAPYEALVRAAALLNTPDVAARAAADPRYRAESQDPPRRVERALALFDCINCDKCLPACPNDANFVYEAAPLARDYENYRVQGGRAVPIAGGRFEVRECHQLACYQDFCNDCGNCDTFCPEHGGPYLRKPRLFGSLGAYCRSADRDGFCMVKRPASEAMWGRLGGAEYRLVVDRAADRAVFTDGRVALELRHSRRAPLAASALADAEDGAVLDVGAYFKMATILDGVLDTSRVNPVNVASRDIRRSGSSTSGRA